MFLIEQMAMLGVRLEDTSTANQKFSDDSRYRALMNAEFKIIQLINNEFLDSLSTSQANVTVTNGVLALSGISNLVLMEKKGILKAKVTDGKWIDIRDFAQVKSQENQFYSGNNVLPTCYVYGKSIYFQPTTITNADLYYLKAPTQYPFGVNHAALGTYYLHQATTPAATTTFLAYADQGLDISTTDFYKDCVIAEANIPLTVFTYHKVTAYNKTTLQFTVTPARSTNFGTSYFKFLQPGTIDIDNLYGVKSELDDSLHEIVVTLAESELWGTARDFDRQKAAYASALIQITAMNDKAKG